MMTKEQKQAIIDLESKAGKLEPRDVINAAKPADSPLHPLFDWDNNVAGDAWRMEQARTIIRRVKITITVESIPLKVVRYVRNPQAKPEDSEYVALPNVKAIDAKAILRTEMRGIIALIDRAKGVAASQAKYAPSLASQLVGLKHDADTILKSI